MAVDDGSWADLYFGPGSEGRHGIVILGGDAALQGEGGHGAVHRARVEPVESQAGGYGGRDGRLPCSGGSIYGDQEGMRSERVRPGQMAEIIGESGVARCGGAEPGDDTSLTRRGGEGGHCSCHGHSVITLAVETGPAKLGSTAPDARDGQGVPLRHGCGAEGCHHLDHRVQPIDLLDPKLPYLREHRGALGHSGSHGQHGNLVQGRDLSRGHRGGPQGWAAGCGGCSNGGGSVRSGRDGDLRTHPLEDRDVAQPGRPLVDPFHLHRAPRNDAAGHHEEGRRRRIARRGARRDRAEARRVDSDDPAVTPGLDREVDTRFDQHLLGVGPRGDPLSHGRRALGGQAGQENGRLDLGAGDPGGPVDAVERAARDSQRGPAVGT
jgi:hypothetical protein